MINEHTRGNNYLQIVRSISSSKYFLITIFTILTAISAQIAIPVKPVPFTMQTLLVLLSGAFLGSRNGAYSQVLYLFIGIVGLPVFAQVPDAPLGFARIIGPTGGYLLAFPVAAYVTGFLIEKRRNYLAVVASMFIGELLILLFGVFYLAVFFTHNIEEAVNTGAAIFSIWMVAKVLIGTAIYKAVTGSQKQ